MAVVRQTYRALEGETDRKNPKDRQKKHRHTETQRERQRERQTEIQRHRQRLSLSVWTQSSPVQSRQTTWGSHTINTDHCALIHTHTPLTVKAHTTDIQWQCTPLSSDSVTESSARMHDSTDLQHGGVRRHGRYVVKLQEHAPDVSPETQAPGRTLGLSLLYQRGHDAQHYTHHAPPRTHRIGNPHLDRN